MVAGRVKPVSAMNSHNTLILVGNLILEVTPGAPDEALNALVESMQTNVDKTPLPPIRSYLPQEDFENATQRYALGPVAFRSAAETLGRPEFAVLADAVGFSSGAEAMLARYKAGALLILIDYPTPQLAELHLRHLEASLPEKAKRAGGKAERKGPTLPRVIAPAVAGYAAHLRTAVNYETQGTWNEPSGTAPQPPRAVLFCS